MNMEIVDRLHARLASAEHSATPDFRRLLGDAAWHRLPKAVQARFCASAHAVDATEYRGSMCVRASLVGRAFAHICRLVGTPVAPWVGDAVNVQVRVFESDRGIVWERRYEFADRAPVIVRSTKALNDDGALVESLGAGLNMRLEVSEKDGELHFVSTGYYFEVAGLRVTLPSWFLPGITRVIHEDLGGGEFRFTMTTDHRWFGRLYFQQGIFH
jgi:hypothetical protein